VQNQKLVLKTIETIKENSPEYPSLMTKRIKRKERRGQKSLYESRVNDSIRLVWYFEKERLIFMMRVGHHDVEKMRKVQSY